MLRRFFLTAALLALVACSSEADKRHTAETNLQSWAATIRTVAEQWSQGRVPNGYSRAALERARQGIDRELAALRSGPDSEALSARGRQLVALANELRTAIERADRRGVRTILAR